MKRQRPLLIAGILAVLLLGGVFVFFIPHSAFRIPHSVSTKAVYYCPMHPSYTSDRPGDCPICNMRLVKREEQQSAASNQQPAEANPQSAIRNPQSTKDICYLHNCPMVHEGRPCPMLVVAKAGERVICPICGAHVADRPSTKRILYWTDPMLPGYKSDKPGKSPMGMDLVAVYADTSGEPAGASSPVGYTSILVTPQKQQLIGVKTDAVSRRALTKTVRTVGTIAHDPELYQAQAEYLQAVQALARAKQGAAPASVVEQAQQLVDAAQIHLTHLGLNEDLIRELATKSKADHSLLFGRAGEPVWMYAKLYEDDLPLVKVGQEVRVEAPSLPGQAFHGTIRAMDAMVDAMTRTVRFRAQLENPEGQLKPEMYVNVSVTVDLGEVLAIPEEAVFNTGTKQIVFVDKGQGLFEPRDVTVGPKADGYYEVKAGVMEGEAAVTSGNFLIDSESRLKAALQGMAGEPRVDSP